MITIFNKKALINTYDMKTQADIRNKLAAGNVDYRVKVINRNSPSPFSAGERARSGAFKEKVDLEREYIIYVRKKDYELAIKTINKK
mgnify:CR=1 FL=1